MITPIYLYGKMLEVLADSGEEIGPRFGSVDERGRFISELLSSLMENEDTTSIRSGRLMVEKEYDDDGNFEGVRFFVEIGSML